MLRLRTLILPLLAASLAHSQPAAGRPILFVHGFCEQASDWGVLRDAYVTSYVTGAQPSLYANSTNYNIYYDGQSVKTWPDGKDFLSNVPSSARFFSINFFDELSFGGNGAFSSINTTQVMQVSILNKADELAHVIQAITKLAQVKDVIVIAHSMGGLVARAYIESQAIPYTPTCCLMLRILRPNALAA